MIHYASILGFFLLGMVPPAEGPLEAVRAGFKVAVDPETGRIVAQPTEADLAVLSEGIVPIRRGSSWELETFELATGGSGVFLDGWADHSLTVVRDEAGGLRVACTQGDDHAAEGASEEEAAAGAGRSGEALR